MSSTKNEKTYTDILFEGYLKQNNIAYTYEPFSSQHVGDKNPDFLFQKDNQKILVECKELKSLPTDGLIGTASFDMKRFTDPLKFRIKEASKQLKPYINQVDSTIIIFAKKEGYQIQLNHIKYAMFGDPEFRIPFDPSGKNKPGSMYSDFKANGKLRRNDPESKLTIPYSRHISGVGIVTKTNKRNFYISKLIDKKLDTLGYEVTYDDKHLEENINKLFNINAECSKDKPIIELNPKEDLCIIEIVINPFTTHPLNNNMFNAFGDIVEHVTYTTEKI